MKRTLVSHTQNCIFLWLFRNGFLLQCAQHWPQLITYVIIVKVLLLYPDLLSTNFGSTVHVATFKPTASQ